MSDYKPVPFAVRCRCGMQLFRGSTAKFADPRAPYHCVGCRPRPNAQSYSQAAR